MMTATSSSWLRTLHEEWHGSGHRARVRRDGEIRRRSLPFRTEVCTPQMAEEIMRHNLEIDVRELRRDRRRRVHRQRPLVDVGTRLHRPRLSNCCTHHQRGEPYLKPSSSSSVAVATIGGTELMSCSRTRGSMDVLRGDRRWRHADEHDRQSEQPSATRQGGEETRRTLPRSMARRTPSPAGPPSWAFHPAGLHTGEVSGATRTQWHWRASPHVWLRSRWRRGRLHRARPVIG